MKREIILLKRILDKLLSDSVEYANEARPLHISSPLHSTPKRTNKRDQHSDATSALQYSPIDGAQPKTSDQMNTSHGFSCTGSHTTHTSMSLVTSPALMPVLNIPPTFRLQRNTTKYELVCTINFRSLISHEKHLQLCQFIETYKLDVIFGCETKIEPSIQSSSIFPDEYTMSQPKPQRSCPWMRRSFRSKAWKTL